MAGDYVVWKSEFIQTVDEARAYYRQRLASKVHAIECYGHGVTVAFERDNTHTYSEDWTTHNAGAEEARTSLGSGRFESRAFAIERAVLLDGILPAICRHTGVINDRAPGRKRLHGARLPDGQYLRVILRPIGASDFDWYCVTAFPVPREKWLEDQRSPKVKFPPQKKTPR